MRAAKHQKHETYLVVGLLGVIGGFLDAYTFITRGGVFANAQTGNVVLLGVELANGQWRHAIYYIAPITAFIIGIAVAELIRKVHPEDSSLHWGQIVLFVEVIVLAVVAFLPATQWDTLVNIMISFVSSLQTQAFRRVKGNPLVTTMCTGNLRSATEHLFRYYRTKDKKTLTMSLEYCGIVGLFIVGAVIGTICSKFLGIRSALVGCMMLAAVFGIMFQGREEVKL